MCPKFTVVVDRNSWHHQTTGLAFDDAIPPTTTEASRGVKSRCEFDTYLLAAIEQLTQHSVRLSSRRFLFDTLFSNGQLGHQLGIPSPLPPRHHRCPLFLTVLSDQRFDFLRENYLATTVFCNFSISQKICMIFFLSLKCILKKSETDFL